MRTFLLLLLAAAAVSAQPAPPPTGAWHGTLEAGAARLRLVLRISGGDSPKASIDSIGQGARGIPVTSIHHDGETLRLELKPLGASFEGRVNREAGEIAGHWRQGGAVLPLVFRRGEPPGRPQEPRKPYPYREEEVVLGSATAGVKLAGTLTLPVSKAPLAALVLLTGSGAQDRDESVFGHRPFLVLADFLTRRGFAVLRLDDRGVGGSGGDLGEAAYEDLAGDALAAVEYLRSRKDLGGAPAGLAGHSEGASVAAIAAARSAAVAFLVLLAATGVPGEQVMLSQSGLLGAGAEKNRELQRRLFAAVKETSDRAELEKRLRGIVAGFAAGLDEKAIEAQARVMSSPAFRSLLTHDPAGTLRRVKAPVLVLAGAKDVQVASALNLPPIAAALEAGGNQNYSIVKLPDLNHLFQTCRTGGVEEYSTIEETFSPRALEAIAGWLERQAR